MINPKLALDFTTGALDSRVTFTRTTSASNPATYVNSSGVITEATNDQPRFDYDPVTLVCKGLLVEESRQNLFTYSNDFDVSPWLVLNASVTANTTFSPDGTQNADTYNATTTAGFLYRSPNFTSGLIYAYSVYAKAINGTQIRLVGNNASLGLGVGIFNLINGTVSSVTGTGTSAQIFNAGNGWYRCVLYLTASGTGSYQIRLTGNATETGNLFAIYGAQLEAGAFATSYIPTGATALTRNADVATMTGTNFSDFWQADKGGASVLATPSTVSGVRPLVQFDDNTANEIIALRGNTTNPELYIVDGGTLQAQIDAGTIATNTAYSLTGWWQTNDCKARKDSGVVVADTTATIPTITQARLGSDGTNYLNGHLATVNYYDQFSGQIYARHKNKAVFSLL